MADNINVLGVPRPTPARPEFTWSPGGAPGDPNYAYSDGADSGAKKAAYNTLITFTASANVPVVAYEWDFGDGTRALGPVVTHTFKILNPHLRVILTITDAAGARHHVGHQMMLA